MTDSANLKSAPFSALLHFSAAAVGEVGSLERPLFAKAQTDFIFIDDANPMVFRRMASTKIFQAPFETIAQLSALVGNLSFC